MLAYSDIREIQKKEMDSAAIVVLEKEFYVKLRELLAKKKKEALESSSLLSMKEYENIKRIALSVHAKREEKLVLMALRGENSVPGLSEEEEILLVQVREVVKKARASFKEALGEDEGYAPRINKIRILNDVEQYVGLDKSLYGPFKKDEEHALPKEEAEWLLKSKMAEMIR